MPFFKKDNDNLLTAPNFVYAPDYTLKADEKDSYEYPIDGWYWFETLDEAMLNMSNPTQASQTVTMRQARLALHNAGLLETVQAVVANADASVQIEWEYADSFSRNWPTLLTMQAQLGLTDAQVDELFTQAAIL